jgi:hypothetical protein
MWYFFTYSIQLLAKLGLLKAYSQPYPPKTSHNKLLLNCLTNKQPCITQQIALLKTTVATSELFVQNSLPNLKKLPHPALDYDHLIIGL